MVYAKTLLERAKGSALDITAKNCSPSGAVTLLRPHNQQIKCLELDWVHWRVIQYFSEVNSGPLPLLRTLKISAVNEFNFDAESEMTPPSLPLFTSAVNLKEFVLHSERFSFLNHFVFPNLTTFELSVTPGWDRFRASELLDFLEASPALRTAQMKIIGDLVVQDVPQERVVVLPSVESFALMVDDGERGFIMATHISCPSTKGTSILHEKVANDTIPTTIFPASIPWKTIVDQYTRSPVESVALKLERGHDPFFTGSVFFRSFDATDLQLSFGVSASDEDEEFLMPDHDLHNEAFSQAYRTLRDHPSLDKAKRLHINHRAHFGPDESIPITNEIGQLFKSLGTLDELTMYGCDLHSYVTPFFDRSNGNGLGQPAVFPPTKELWISHPISPDKEECVEIITELAKSRHALGIPFEHVTVCMERLPESMAEMLKPWVGGVDCYDEPCVGGYM